MGKTIRAVVLLEIPLPTWKVLVTWLESHEYDINTDYEDLGMLKAFKDLVMDKVCPPW